MTVVVADRGLLGLTALAPATWEIREYEGRIIPEALLRDATALLVRSTVNLQAVRWPSSLRFVGTATIGTDHLPLEDLRRMGITVASSPGCNAFAVTDYVLATVLDWARMRGRDWSSLTLGIVGVGAVGGRLATRARRLGLRVLVSDAPKFDAGDCPSHQALDAVLMASDVVTLHVPLSSAGQYPTRGLLSDAQVATIRSDGLLINTARGPVVSEQALCQGRCDLALDVFPDEPLVSDALLERAWRITPHIAGHSVEGKLRGTQQVVEAFCALEGVRTKPFDVEAFADAIVTRPAMDSETAQMLACCPLAEVDQTLRSALHGAPVAQRAARFDRVRQAYPLRRESRADLPVEEGR